MINHMVKEEVKNALNEYDIIVEGIKTESFKVKKGVWWISTPNGQKILKMHSYPDKTLNFIIAATEHLMNNGIHIPEIIRTKNGHNYVQINKHCFILTEAIHGKTLSYTDSDELKRVVLELASFHKASKGFIAPRSCKIRTHLGHWIKKYRNQVNKLKSYYQIECANGNHTEFGTIIMREFPYFINRMEIAINELNQNNYRRWNEEVAKIGGLCHQDFTAGNLILDDNNAIYVLDTDSITVDIPMRDIRKILNKIMKRRNEWDFELVKDILKWYQLRNPLETWQWKVLKPALIYPNLFEGIMSKYYERREKSWTEEKYLKRLNEMIKIEKSVEPIIKEFDKILPV